MRVTLLSAVLLATLNACNDDTTDEGGATALAFVTQPTDAVAGATVSPAVTVAIRDASGMTVSGAAHAVTIALGTAPGGGALLGTVTVPAVNGVAAFPDLRIDAPGTGYTLAASAAGLTSATSAPFDVTPLPANATRVLLTDDPFPYERVDRVDVYFVSVSGSLSPDTGTSGTFVTLAEPHRRINLLALQGGVTDEIGALALPEGIITAVRVVIDTDSSSITLTDGRVLTATSSPGIAWQSSAGRPVLNALIHEQILVPDTGGVVAVIYDVGEAFIPRQVVEPGSTDSGFIFSPVLRAADATRTGSIAGIVRAGSASGAPVTNASLQLYLGDAADPENTWIRLATARSATDGTFRFAFVTPDAYWDQFPARANDVYIVAVDPPTGSGLARTLVDSVAVSAATETALGVVVLPSAP